MRSVGREGWLWACIVFACGLASRLLFVVWAPFPAGDSEAYLGLARNLVEHGQFAFDIASPTIARPPGYPWFLAGLSCFTPGHDELWHLTLWTQALLGAGSGVLLLQVLERHFRVPIARLVAVGVALYPYLNFWAATILSETLLAACLVATLWAVDTARLCAQRANWRGQVLAMLAAAVAGVWCVWLTPRLVVVPLFAAGALWLGCREFSTRRAGRAGALCGLACLLLLAPWTWRNWRAFGVATPSALQSPGFQFWLAARRVETLGYKKPPISTHPLMLRHMDLMRDDAHEQQRTPERLQLEQDFFHDGSAFIAADPLGFLRDRARRYPGLWVEPTIYVGYFKEPLKRFNPQLSVMWRRRDLLALAGRLVPVVLWVVLPLVLVPWGLWSARGRWREFALVYALFAWIALSGAAFNIEQRYSVVIHPLLALFVAAALQDIQAFRQRRRQNHANRRAPVEAATEG